MIVKLGEIKKDWSVESGRSKSIIYLKPVSNM